MFWGTESYAWANSFAWLSCKYLVLIKKICFKTFCQRNWKFWFIFDEFFDLEILGKFSKIVSEFRQNYSHLWSESTIIIESKLTQNLMMTMATSTTLMMMMPWQWKEKFEDSLVGKIFQDLSPFGNFDWKWCLFFTFNKIIPTIWF